MLTALLTGGSAGIGRAIASGLLAAGHRVVSLDHAPATIDLEHLHTLPVDLLSAAETHDAALQAAERWRPTILVHNAGAIRPALLPDVNRVDLDALGSLHLGAAITLVQATLPAMRAGISRSSLQCISPIAMFRSILTCSERSSATGHSVMARSSRRRTPSS